MTEDFGYNWGPWIEHDGTHPGKYINTRFDTIEALVQVERHPGSEEYLVDEAHHIHWEHRGTAEDIKRFRLEIGYWSQVR